MKSTLYGIGVGPGDKELLTVKAVRAIENSDVVVAPSAMEGGESIALETAKEYIKEGKMSDYQDHYYPSEMAVDAQIQTFLINQDVDAFLAKFDKDWQRYNRDIIRAVQEYNEEHGSAE